MPPRDASQRPHAPPLDELFREHAQGLAGAVRSVLGSSADVREVLQEAFLRAWRSRDKGVPRDPVAWIFVVTLNLAKDQRRREKRRRPDRGLEDAMTELCAREPLPQASLEREEAVEAARGAIERLKDPEKEIFLLRVSAGLSFEAAADALQIPVGTAKTRMRAALARLRADLAPYAPESAATSSTPFGPPIPDADTQPNTLRRRTS